MNILDKILMQFIVPILLIVASLLAIAMGAYAIYLILSLGFGVC